MPKVRNIVGDVRIEVASGTRKCHANSKHEILADETHLAVYKGVSRENFCQECAGPILDLAIRHLQTVQAELFPKAGT